MAMVLDCTELNARAKVIVIPPFAESFLYIICRAAAERMLAFYFKELCERRFHKSIG